MGSTRDARRKMRRQGSEDVGHEVNSFAPLMPAKLKAMPLPGPSKEAMRAETAALVAGLPVTRLPTVRELRCPCGHYGKATHAPGRSPTFRCRKCGARV